MNNFGYNLRYLRKAYKLNRTGFSRCGLLLFVVVENVLIYCVFDVFVFLKFRGFH